MTIKIPDNYMGKPIKGSLEKVLASAPVSPPSNPTPSNPNPPIQINALSDAWQISGVGYRNGLYTVDLAKSLLENGTAKTQDEWAAYSGVAMAQGEFRTPDYPLLYGIVKALYTARNDTTKSSEVEEAKQFLKSTARAKWLMTLTRMQCKKSGNDLIIHNFGTNDRYEKNVDFVGSDEYISKTQNVVPYQTLLDTIDSGQEIKNTFEWLNGTDTYLYRVNSKQDTERVARFNAYSGGALLDCGWYPACANSSLRVRIGAAGTVAPQK